MRHKAQSRLAISIAASAFLSGVLPGAALAAGSGVPVSATEGQQFSGPVATFDHPVRTATITWGDGGKSAFVAPTANGSTTVTGSHTYAEDGSYGVTINDTTCGQGTCDQASTTASVGDAALSATGSSISATAGSSFSGRVATFNDSDPQGTAGDYTATIDWGDGSSSAGSISASSGGGFEVDGSHTYSSGGTYRMRVTISDQGGASTSASSSAAVAPPPLRASFTASAASAKIGQLVSFDASDSKSGGVTISGYQWLVNGKPAATCDGRTSMVSTRFPSPGPETITLIATDASGNRSTATRSILVGLAGDRPAADTAGPQGGGVASAARRTRGKLRVIKVPAVYECDSGRADTFHGAIEGLVPQENGAGCTKQLEAGIVQVDGCLTEHLDTIDVLLQHIKGTPFFEEAPRQDQPLDGIPNPEALTFESDIALQFSVNPHILCSKYPQYRSILCPTIPGASDETPSTVTGAGPCGKPPLDPCPAGVPPTRPAGDVRTRATADPVGHAAAIKGASSPNVAIQTACNHDITPPKPGEAGFVHPCFRLFVSHDPVVLNGLTYIPAPGAVILVSPEFNIVVSSSAAVKMGLVKIRDYGPINYQLPGTPEDPSSGDFPAFSVLSTGPILESQPDAAKPVRDGGLSLGGLHSIGGSLRGALENHSARVTYEVALPGPINDGNGGPVTAQVAVDFNAAGDITGISGGVKNISVFLGPVAIQHFSACWREHYGVGICPTMTGIPDDPSFGDNFWDASGELDVGKVALVFRPTDTTKTACSGRLGIGFGGDKLDFVGAALDAGPTGIEIFPGVALTDLGASFNSSDTATSLCAFADFDVAGGLARVQGQVFAVWTKHGTPYQFGGAELGPGNLRPSGPKSTFPFTNDFALGAGGTLFVRFPTIGDVRVGGGYALYVNDPRAIFFGAGFDFSIPAGNTYEDPPDAGLAIEGGIDGGVGLSGGFPFFLDGHVGVKGRAKLCLGVGRFSVCHSVAIFDGHIEAIISHARDGGGGIAVCGDITVGDPPIGFTATGGIGYHWGDDLGDIILHDLHTGGCDFLNEFRVDVQKAHDAAAGSYRFRVPRGSSAVDLYVGGHDGAPDLTVTGPGVHASSAGVPDQHGARVGNVLFARFSAVQQTYVTLLHPAPGVYHLQENPGSPGVVSIRQADGITPSVSARVIGRGVKRQLRYRIAPHPGQQIEFIEQSAQTRRILGTSSRAHGTIALLAVPGRGRRYISAEVIQDGRPAEVLQVASYQPPGRQKLGAVRWVRVRRRGTRASVRFAGVAGTREYWVLLESRDGTRRVYLTRKRAVTITGLYPEFGGRISVKALGDDVFTLDGRARRSGLPAAIRPPAASPAPHRRHRRSGRRRR